MKIRSSLAPILLLGLISAAAAQEGPAGSPVVSARILLPDDPAPLLDWTLAEAWSRLGPPRSIQAVRGNEAWQDDVAFDYADGVTVYWYRNRLWQVRLSAGYGGSCFGFFLGDSADKALSLLGTPDRNEPGILEWRLPWRGYPAKLRILTRDGRILEAYVYRSDY